uniref:Uncharacterized protein n=1 Tax=Panagrolaimus sp. PS1159 TaxID=55785 RepID=A0AC35FJM6_9BILA
MSETETLPPKTKKPSDLLQDDKDVQQAIKDAEEEARKRKEMESKTKWRRIKETLVEWGSISSCHGIPHMAQAHSCMAIIVWIFILVVCFSIFLYLFIDTLVQFLSFEKLVELQMDLDEMVFPSVTICNINPYKESAIEQNEQLKALLTVYDEVVNKAN